MPEPAPIVTMNETMVTARRTPKMMRKWCWKVRWIQEIMGGKERG